MTSQADAVGCQICCVHLMRNNKAKNSALHRSYGQAYLHNKHRSNLNMLIERPNVTSYPMTILMFELFITICDLFTMEMCMTFTLTFSAGQDQT